MFIENVRVRKIKNVQRKAVFDNKKGPSPKGKSPFFGTTGFGPPDPPHKIAAHCSQFCSDQIPPLNKKRTFP